MTKSLVALRLREDYDRTFRQGLVFHTKYFTLRVLTKNSKQVRVAIVVSKKVSAKATVRNLLRRRIRGHMRISENALEGRDIIVHVKPEVVKLSRKELYEHLARAITALRRKSA